MFWNLGDRRFKTNYFKFTPKDHYNQRAEITTRRRAVVTFTDFFFISGNMANVIRYFPTQALNFAFKDTVKSMFKTAKDAPQYEKFGKNILSGGVAGSLSLTFVYSLDYCRTRYTPWI